MSPTPRPLSANHPRGGADLASAIHTTFGYLRDIVGSVVTCCDTTHLQRAPDRQAFIYHAAGCEAVPTVAIEGLPSR